MPTKATPMRELNFSAVHPPCSGKDLLLKRQVLVGNSLLARDQRLKFLRRRFDGSSRRQQLCWQELLSGGEWRLAIQLPHTNKRRGGNTETLLTDKRVL